MPREPDVDLAEALSGPDGLTATLLEELTADGSRVRIRELARAGRLTPFQADRLLRGQGRDLVLGPYLLLDFLGEGAMGQVYKARHRLLHRLVALKVLRGERLAHPDAVARFRREAWAAARLSHPHIVAVYDAGCLVGRHFLAMEYVEGTDLYQLIERHGRLSVEQACAYVHQAALGLQHIHENGLVHRDIKPGNLMVASGQWLVASEEKESSRSSLATSHWPLATVKILDLGVVRFSGTDASASSTTILTQGGAVMGTVDYLAPEQAIAPHQADIRADLYSLGCTFYHLLTGQPPFPGGTLAQKLIQHQLHEPQPAEALHPDLPAGVRAILNRLLAKRPEDRYQTPAEVAAALAPFGPRPGRATVVRRVAPPTATAAAPLPNPAKLEARGRRSAMRNGLMISGIGTAFLLGVLAMVLAEGGAPANGSASPLLALRSAFVPASEFGPSMAPKPLDLAHPEPARFPTGTQVYGLAGSADGSSILLACGDRTVRLWDGSGRERRRLLGHTDWVSSVAVSADGRRALSGGGDHTVRLWDVANGTQVRRFDGHTAPVLCVALSPDGRSALSGSQDRTIRLWSVSGGRELHRFEGHTDLVRGVAFSPDGRTFVSGSFDGSVRRWDVGSGQELRRFAGHGNHVLGVAYSPDGRLVVSGGYDGVARLWDVNTGQEVRQFAGHGEYVAWVTFSPDGCHILSGGSDGILRWWDLATGQEVNRWEGHTHAIVSGWLFPDGRILSAGGDQVVRMWDPPR